MVVEPQVSARVKKEERRTLLEHAYKPANSPDHYGLKNLGKRKSRASSSGSKSKSKRSKSSQHRSEQLGLEIFQYARKKKQKAQPAEENRQAKRQVNVDAKQYHKLTKMRSE